MTMTSAPDPRLLSKPQSTITAISARKAPVVAAAQPYASEWEYLDDWFALVKGPLEPKPEKEEAPIDRAKTAAELMSRTDATLRARVPLPFEAYVRENNFDMTDRGLLVSRPAPPEVGPASDSDLLDRVDIAMARLIRRITCSFDLDDPHWCGPARHGAGWSVFTAQARGMLLAVEELRRHGSGPAAVALREMNLSPQEETLFIALLCDARRLGDGYHVGFLMSFVEKCTGELPDWEEVGGPDSRLLRENLLESKGTGPLYQHYLRLRDDAAGKLLPGVSCTASEKTKPNEEALRPYDRIEPKTKLVNAVLSPDLFEELTEALQAVRTKSDLREKWGIRQSSLEGDGFILLFEGPSGTGKTYTAEAVAHSLGRPLFSARLDQLFSKWIGQTEKGIAALFRQAEEEDAVVLLDEADALVGTREGNRFSWEITEVNVLLMELERFRGVAILTTNRPYALDPALERRLAARLTFTLPGPKERERLWRVHLPSRAAIVHDIDFTALGARYTLSGSQIRAACARAARAAFRRKGTDQVIRQGDLEAASRKVTQDDAVEPKLGGDPLDRLFLPLRGLALGRFGNLDGEREEAFEEGLVDRDLDGGGGTAVAAELHEATPDERRIGREVARHGAAGPGFAPDALQGSFVRSEGLLNCGSASDVSAPCNRPHCSFRSGC